MKTLLNNCIFKGRLTADVETINDGTIAKFNLAVNETYKNKEGQKVTDVTYIPVVVFNPNLITILGKVKVGKGSKMTVATYVRTNTWEKEVKGADPVKITSTNFILREFHLEESRKDS